MKRNSRKSIVQSEWMFYLFIALIVGGAVFIFTKFKANAPHYTIYSDYKSKLSSWFAQNKNKVPEKSNVIKKTTRAKSIEAENEVNFEFYTELPNMKVNEPTIRTSEK